MLLALSIRNFVIVDTLDLEFAPGFTVLTGETGAGKSILVDALLAAFGERADADVIRDGATRAEISAEFRLSEPARAWLQLNDLDRDGDTLLLRRTIDSSSRSKGFINGTPATLGQLRALGELLLDVHGQHAHQSLLRPAAQLQLLDTHGGLKDPASEVARTFEALRRARKNLADAEAMAGAAQAEQDRLRWIVDELSEVAPQPGEWAEIEAEHRRLAHAASLLEGTRLAVDLLSEADDAALVRVDAALARLDNLAEYDARLQPLRETLAAARAQIDDAARELNHYHDRADLDQAGLQQAEARVGQLHAASRKFKCAPDELASMLDDARARLAALSAASDLDGLRTQQRKAEADYDRAAASLSAQRGQAARHMAEEVTRAMQDLSLAGGRFEVQLQPGEASATGSERVEFLVAGHAGVPPKPLAKVASGGELSRISLAIAVIAASANPVATLIFDEVDAGIGGAVAETVGRLLQHLGRERQVLCVTHLPQVAARGDQHLVVSKRTDGSGRPESQVIALDRRSRIDELARMLGGLEITDTTRKHARELLTG